MKYSLLYQMSQSLYNKLKHAVYTALDETLCYYNEEEEEKKEEKEKEEKESEVIKH